MPNDTAPAHRILVVDDERRDVGLVAYYLAKPFSPKELVLRVGAILRRLAAPPVAAGGRLVGGPIVLDRTAHRVTAEGKEVELTATEFKLLERLIERRDRVQSRSQLLESVWQAQPTSRHVPWTCTSSACAPNSASRATGSKPCAPSGIGSASRPRRRRDPPPPRAADAHETRHAAVREHRRARGCRGRGFDHRRRRAPAPASRA